MTKKDLFQKFTPPKQSDKILLLTHNDMDGSGPVILLKLIFPNLVVKHCTNKSMSYEIKNAVCNPDENITYDRLIVTDISCNEDDAEKINKHPASHKLILIDHHQTAMNLNKYSWAVVEPGMVTDSYRTAYYDDMSKAHSSATALLYDFLDYHGLLSKAYTGYAPGDIRLGLIQNIVHSISAYDTWDWVTVFEKEQKFQDMDSLFEFYGEALFEDKMLRSIKGNVTIFDDEAKLLLTIKQNKVNKYIDNIQKCFKTGNIEFDGKYYSIVFCNSSEYPTETFDKMKELYPEHDLYMINYGTGLSLRTTKDDINVGLLLKSIGGGGHPGAGGIKIPTETMNMVIEQTLHAPLFIDEPTTKDTYV